MEWLAIQPPAPRPNKFALAAPAPLQPRLWEKSVL